MISSNHFTLAILLMATITFGVRYAFFMQSLQFNLHPQIKSLLTFTAPCVLTALFIPIMFQDIIALSEPSIMQTQGSLIAEKLFTSSYFWASLVTIILSLFIRQTLIVIVLGMLTFYGLRAIM